MRTHLDLASLVVLLATSAAAETPKQDSLPRPEGVSSLPPYELISHEDAAPVKTARQILAEVRAKRSHLCGPQCECGCNDGQACVCDKDSGRGAHVGTPISQHITAPTLPAPVRSFSPRIRYPVIVPRESPPAVFYGGFGGFGGGMMMGGGCAGGG